MRKDVINALSALALISGASCAGIAAAQTGVGSSDTMQTPPVTAPSKPAVGDTSPSLSLPPAEELLGKRVVGANEETLGRVEDALLAPDGQPMLLIVSTEEVTGARGKEVAIDMSRVEIRSDSADLYVANTTRQDIASMPAYVGDEGTMTSLSHGRNGQPQ